MEKIEKRRIRAKEDDKVAEGTASTPTASDGMSPLWRETMGPFFDALGISLKEGTERILAGHNGKKLIRAANDRAAQQMRNPRYVSPESLRAVFGPDEVPEADFHEAMDKLQGAPTTAAMEVPARGPFLGGALPEPGSNLLSLLPEPAESSSLLKVLASKATLTATSQEAIQAMVEVSLNDEQLDDVPERLLKEIEQYARDNGEEVGNEYFELQAVVRSRKYGEYHTDRQAASKEKRDLLYSDLKELHIAAGEFHRVLSNWVGSMERGVGMMVYALLRGQRPQYPNHATVVSASEGVIAVLKRAHSSVGGMTVRAIICENARAREVLTRKNLPQLVGKPNLEGVKALLGCRADSLDTVMEQAVVKYVMAVARTVPNLPAGKAGPTLEELHSLGEEIKGWMETGRIGSAVRSTNFPKPVGRNQAPTPLLGNGARQR